MAKPKILVLGNDEIKANIIEAGFEICDPLEKDCDYSAIIIDINSSSFDKQFISNIGKSGPMRVLTFAWANNNQNKMEYNNIIQMGFDGVFYENTPIEYIKTRLNSSYRIRTMAHEAKLRFKTLEAFEPKRFEIDTKNEKPYRILLYGQPCPFILKLNAIFDSLNILTISALSSFTAFEFLHRGNFDAIIIIAQDDKVGVSSFCSGLRRNSRLYHLPCFVFGNENFDRLEDLIQKGATDIAYIGLEDELAIARLMTLIDEKRRREQIAIHFAMTKTSKVADSMTGLYSDKYFIAHCNQLYRDGIKTNDFFALGFIKIIPYNNGQLDLDEVDQAKVLNQTGSMISRLVRTEDSACRFDKDTFALILPNTNNQEASIALNRICAVLETSAFSTKDNSSCMVLTKKWHIGINEKNNPIDAIDSARIAMN